MEPPHDKPVTKRRPWRVIAIAVLALMSLGTWWLWPRVDPRLVGEWQLAPRDPESFAPHLKFKVRADGLVDHAELPYARGQRGTRSIIQAGGAMRFKVSGDQFEVRDDGAAGLMQLVVMANNLVRGRRPEVISKGRIVSVDAEKLVLTFELWGELVFLRAEDGTLDRRMRERAAGGPVMASPRAAAPSSRPSPRRGEGD